MRIITPEKIQKIQGAGGKVLTEKGRPYVPWVKKPVKEPGPIEPDQPQEKPAPKDDPFMREITGSIVEILKGQQAVIQELSKPKPKKQWGCSVARDRDGKIKTIDIKEA